MAFLQTLALVALSFIVLSYLIPHLILTFLKPRDLKRAYGAKWGLVTGASSGEKCLFKGYFHLYAHRPYPLGQARRLVL